MTELPAVRGPGPLSVVLAILVVFIIIYTVPFIVYGLFSVIAGLSPPGDASPTTFLTSVFISKIGTAVAFVLIFYIARESLSGQILAYSFLWWFMFTTGEVGQAIGPDYTWMMAVAGIISETIYFPLAAFVTNWFLGIA